MVYDTVNYSMIHHYFPICSQIVDEFVSFPCVFGAFSISLYFLFADRLM